ncbi:hypothetical protein PCANB_003042 [Pneumocystis canis]|nr:hypothetical protein PCANB_003042 [Pneumocystis canis]
MDINQEIEETETKHSKIQVFFNKYYGMGALILSQPLYSTMNVCVKVLSQNPIQPWNAFQVIFFRMVPTFIFTIIYNKFFKISRKYAVETSHQYHSNLKVKFFLFLRGIFGFIGLCSIYYSIHHLDLSNVTALLFLNPIFINLFAHPILYKTFNVFDIYAGLISFSGVICIAKPNIILDNYFLHKSSNKDYSKLNMTTFSENSKVMPVLMSLLGVFSTCCSYIIIKGLGNHVDALESILWFSLISSIGSVLVIIFLNMSFYLPLDYFQILMICVIGISGFLAQILLTKGLQIEKIGRASATIYLQIIFSLIYDKIIWGKNPDIWSFLGIALIIIGTTMTIMRKDDETETSSQENIYTYIDNSELDK